MKRLFVIFGVVALSAATTLATLRVADTISSDNLSEATHSTSPFSENAATDALFAASVVPAEYPDLTYAAENAVKAVVNIVATKQVEGRQYFDPFFEFFGYPQGGAQQREAKAGGSGVIISEDGYIVTNNHVIEGATKLRVTLPDGRAFDAKTIGTDPATDVALIKIDASGLPTLPFGSSDDLRLGEWVLAIGYPMELQSTITAGIVSAKARQLGALNNRYGIESFIQTDAAVNPGNSGGALVNTRGELVGINTIIKTSTGSYVGYSFAVPETIVRKVVVDLKESGVVQRAVLGISFRAIDQQFIDELGDDSDIKEIGGIYVASVAEGGSASEAGLRKGDVILSVDGVAVNDSATFLEQIGKRRPGDEITLKLRRGEKEITTKATLQNKAGETSLLSPESVDVEAVLGGQFETISEKSAKALDIRGGVQVVKIKQGGLLERARIKEGYIITHINDRQIRSIDDLARLTDKIRSIDGVYPNGRASSYMIVE
ncbi:MAG: trypsin-like peptidase domain-containing protein [Alistipes sp.]|nr:trypsin-like peptidase domain-containing protein [Alistipes sp.]MBR3590571.1 trypsin-like peptidase domain-containing protein [Alistipes sp.]MBR6630443.1 trypsin-like peptidase domain-containing protein [Alistipes sp.]